MKVRIQSLKTQAASAVLAALFAVPLVWVLAPDEPGDHVETTAVVSNPEGPHRAQQPIQFPAPDPAPASARALAKAHSLEAEPLPPRDSEPPPLAQQPSGPEEVRLFAAQTTPRRTAGSAERRSSPARRKAHPRPREGAKQNRGRLIRRARSAFRPAGGLLAKDASEPTGVVPTETGALAPARRHLRREWARVRAARR